VTRALDNAGEDSKAPRGATPFALRLIWLRRLTVCLVHIGIWACAFRLALDLRFDGVVPPAVASASRIILLCLVVFRLAAFLGGGLFHGLYRYSGLPELKKLILASTIASLLALVVFLIVGQRGVPRSLFLGEWLGSIVGVGGVRMLIRSLYERRRPGKSATRALIIGAGDAGASLMRELQGMREGAEWKVVGFLDDDHRKHGLRVHSVRVLGAADEENLRRAVQRSKVELVILAMPSASGMRVRELVNLCSKLGLRAKTVPGLTERLTGENVQPVREIDIEDLLGRDPVELDVAQVEGLIEGKVVLITGAGGSIGSELARQVLRFKPRRVLLIDHDENAVFFLERELRGAGAQNLKPLVVDITNERRVAWVFDYYRPQVVLHAAAHKHVVLMEDNACEAAWNNVFGTQTLAEAAHEAGAEAFVLISTDKAVNPSSVMGATKRVCELVIQHVAQKSNTRFAAVRFGNVLGSNGSVVPIFREQIANGGPVTVTHPDVTRYFMTIPEAAQLVLQAGALGGTGEIFLLDMGKPVKIVDLARDLIELSGLRPGVDIEIEFSGLKSGEKLFEEMLLDGESSQARPHPQIVVGQVQRLGADGFRRGMSALALAIRMNDELELRRTLVAMVPEATLAVPSQTTTPLRSMRLERLSEHPADTRERVAANEQRSSHAKASAPPRLE